MTLNELMLLQAVVPTPPSYPPPPKKAHWLEQSG